MRGVIRTVTALVVCAAAVLGSAESADARTKLVRPPFEYAGHWETYSVGCGETVTCDAPGTGTVDGVVSSRASVVAPPRDVAQHCTLLDLQCTPTQDNVGWSTSQARVSSTIDIPDSVDAVRVEIRAALDGATISQTGEESTTVAMYVSAIAGNGLYQEGYFFVLFGWELEMQAEPAEEAIVFTLRQTEQGQELGTLHVHAAASAHATARNHSVAGTPEAHEEHADAWAAGRLISIKVTELMT